MPMRIDESVHHASRQHDRPALPESPSAQLISIASTSLNTRTARTFVPAAAPEEASMAGAPATFR